MDSAQIVLFVIIFLLLVVASVVGFKLKKAPFYQHNKELVDEIIIRTNSWWGMTAVVFLAMALGLWGVALLFFILSVLALSEYLSLVSEDGSELYVRYLLLAVVCPLQSFFIMRDLESSLIVLPVCAIISILVLVAILGESEKYLETVGKLCLGFLLCVYFVGFAPALLAGVSSDTSNQGATLLLYLLFLTGLSDVLQFVFGKLFGVTKIAPVLSPNKTAEGLLGALVCIALLSGSLSAIMSYSFAMGLLLGALIVVSGFLGGLVFSAIKRARGVKNFGLLIPGHGGVLDRLDSLCFTAPIFYILVRALGL